MKEIPKLIQSLPAFAELESALENKEARSQKLALIRSARLPVLAALYQHTGRPILLLTQKTDRALTLNDELSLWMEDTPLYYFPEPTSLSTLSTAPMALARSCIIPSPMWSGGTQLGSKPHPSSKTDSSILSPSSWQTFRSPISTRLARECFTTLFRAS